MIGGLHDIPGDHNLQLPVPQNFVNSAGTSFVAAVRVPFKCKLISARFFGLADMNQATDSSSRVLNLKNKNSADQNVGVLQMMSAGTFLRGVGQSFTMAAVDLNEGDWLQVEDAVQGAGLVHQAGVIAMIIRAR